MKKIATLILAAGLVLGASTSANAIDFKIQGEWNMSFQYGQNGNFKNSHIGGNTGYNGSEDEFEAVQRLRLALTAVASEQLSGFVQFEIGKSYWGQRGGGAGMGADENLPIKLKRAYIDWMVPQTDLKVRMGLQGIDLPSFTGDSSILSDDQAGISLSYQFNENVGATFIWARPLNDNYDGDKNEAFRHPNSEKSFMDNLDAFALLIPVTLDGFKITPWGMYAAIGPNALRTTQPFKDTDNPGKNNWTGLISGTTGDMLSGILPIGGALHKDGTMVNEKNGRALRNYGDAFWVGLPGEITYFDPFRIAWDVNYGATRMDDGRLNRQGWLASLLFEYKLDWGIPGIYGWYGSGDDSDPSNGSERMPYITLNNADDGFSRYAFNGGFQFNREATVSNSRTGTWGLGIRLKDFSFIEDLKHTFSINYIGGTNSPTMTKKLSNNILSLNDKDYFTAYSFGLGNDGLYMTTDDSILEFNLTSTYQMYENFKIIVDAGYLATWLSTKTKRANFGEKKDFAGNDIAGSKYGVSDPWNINVNFFYSF